MNPRIIKTRNATTFAEFKKWTSSGLNGYMVYLSDHRGKLRKSIDLVFKDCKSILVATFPYPTPPINGSLIASYATHHGDYHDEIKNKLHELLNSFQKDDPDIKGHVFIDTHPILERDYAIQAGLGWIGKNTSLITKDHGSFVHIGGIALSKDLTSFSINTIDSLERFPKCGKCSRCLEACPTRAFVSPYVLDARRCISYLTIEYKGVIDPEFFPALKGHFFGCDICQIVCPWNKPFLKPAHEDNFNPKEWLSLSKENYKEKVKGTALERMNYAMMQRNALIQLIHTEGFSFTCKHLSTLSHITDLAKDQLNILRNS